MSCDVGGSRVTVPDTLDAPAMAACTNVHGAATSSPSPLASFGAALLGVGVSMLIGYGVDALGHRRAA